MFGRRPPGSVAASVRVLLCLWLGRASTGLEVPDKIYWTSFFAGAIHRANLVDGSDVEEVVHVPESHPWGLAIDAGRCWMYFAEVGAHSIKRAHLDGSGVSVFVQLTDADAIVLWRSEEEDMLYWTQSDARVMRTSLRGDGSVIEELLTYNSGYYYDRWGVAVDTGVTPVKVYFGDNDDFLISRQDWGTEEEDELFVEDPDAIWKPQAMDIDPITRKLYWADDGFAEVRYVGLDGDGYSDVEVLVSGLTAPRGLVLDSIGRKVYFTDIGPSAGSHRIHQVDLDGSLGWTIQLEGIPKPSALAIMNSTSTTAAVCFTTTTTTSTTSSTTSSTTATVTTITSSTSTGTGTTVTSTNTTTTGSTSTRTSTHTTSTSTVSVTTETATSTSTVTTSTATSSIATSSTATSSTATATTVTGTISMTTTIAETTVTSTSTATTTSTTGTLTVTFNTGTATFTNTATVVTTMTATSADPATGKTTMTTTLAATSEASTTATLTATSKTTSTATLAASTEVSSTATLTATSTTTTTAALAASTEVSSTATLTATSTSTAVATLAATSTSTTVATLAATSTTTMSREMTTRGTSETSSTVSPTSASTTFAETEFIVSSTSTLTPVTSTTSMSVTSTTATTIVHQVLIIDGRLALVVSDAASFVIGFTSDPEIAVVLTQGIADAFPGVKANMIEVISVAAVRLLSVATDRVLSTAGSVTVDYRMVLPITEAPLANFTAESVTSHEGELLATISSALDSRTSLAITLDSLTALEPLVWIGSSDTAFDSNFTNMTEGAANDTLTMAVLPPDALELAGEEQAGAASGGVIAGLMGAIMAGALVVCLLARYTTFFRMLQAKLSELAKKRHKADPEFGEADPGLGEADPELGEVSEDRAGGLEVEAKGGGERGEVLSPSAASEDELSHHVGIPKQHSTASAETWDIDAAAIQAVEAAEAAEAAEVARQAQVDGEMEDVPEQPGASPAVSQGFKGRVRMEDDPLPVIPSSMSTASMATWKSLFECVKEEDKAPHEKVPQDQISPSQGPTIMRSVRSEKSMQSSAGPASVILEL